MKQHVSKAQMQALERGEQVTLNLQQLEELQHHAPSWVDVYVHKDTAAGFGQYVVLIKDTRPEHLKPVDIKQQLRQIMKESK